LSTILAHNGCDAALDGRLDKSKWKYSVGPNNANKELEYYSDRPVNSGMDGQGHYLITARKENMNGKAYTSAKFISAGIFSQKYGRFEARIQLPAGKGLWPAFWALGNNINDVGWPECGEIDIMETVGNQLTINRGSMHGPGYSGGNPLTAQYHLQPAPTSPKPFTSSRRSGKRT
jgi:beta-glucanase (GH16 family)